MKLRDIASAVGARLDPPTAAAGNIEIRGLAGIEEAQPGQLTFISNPRYAAAGKTTQASAIIVADDFPALSIPALRTENPYLAFARALEMFYQPPPPEP